MKSVLRKFERTLSPLFYPHRSTDDKLDVCPVDAFAGQTFCVNVFGHIRSDISVLMETQSKSEFDLVAQRLVEAQGESPDNSALTDADLFKFGMSRFYQTPAEVVTFSESLARAQVARAEKIAKDSALKAEIERQQKVRANYMANIEKARQNGQIDNDGNVVTSKE